MFNNIGISGDMSVLIKGEDQIKTVQIKDLVDKEVEFFTGSEWKKDIVKKRELKEEDLPVYKIDLKILSYKDNLPISIGNESIVACKDTRIVNKVAGMVKIGDSTNFWFNSDKDMYQAVVSNVTKEDKDIKEVYYVENIPIIANGVLIDRFNGFGFFNKMNSMKRPNSATRPNVNFRDLFLNRMKKSQNRS